MNTAERLVQIMKEKNINKSQLSKASGVPYTTIDGIMKKGCDNIKLSTMIKLADCFQISLDYLVGRGDDYNLSTYEVDELNSYRTYLLWRKEQING